MDYGFLRNVSKKRSHELADAASLSRTIFGLDISTVGTIQTATRLQKGLSVYTHMAKSRQSNKQILKGELGVCDERVHVEKGKWPSGQLEDSSRCRRNERAFKLLNLSTSF